MYNEIVTDSTFGRLTIYNRNLKKRYQKDELVI